MKATELLQSSMTTTKRAEEFAKSAKRNLQRDIIDTLNDRKDKITDELFTLKDFSLKTDVNAGVIAITRDDAEARFKKIIQLEYELDLLNAELGAKLKSFNNLFSDETTQED